MERSDLSISSRFYRYRTRRAEEDATRPREEQSSSLCNAFFRTAPSARLPRQQTPSLKAAGLRVAIPAAQRPHSRRGLHAGQPWSRRRQPPARRGPHSSHGIIKTNDIRNFQVAAIFLLLYYPQEDAGRKNRKANLAQVLNICLKGGRREGIMYS